MLSKDEIKYGPLIKAAEEFVAKVESGEARSTRSYKAFKEALEGLRYELSVQEGLKDAREAFEDFVTPNGYSIETDPDGEYACPEVRLQKYAFMAGARHADAFALKQKGEAVICGFEPSAIRVNVAMGVRGVCCYVDAGQAALVETALSNIPKGTKTHVTLSLPQQEQDHQGVSTNQEESKS